MVWPSAVALPMCSLCCPRRTFSASARDSLKRASGIPGSEEAACARCCHLPGTQAGSAGGCASRTPPCQHGRLRLQAAGVPRMPAARGCSRGLLRLPGLETDVRSGKTHVLMCKTRQSCLMHLHYLQVCEGACYSNDLPRSRGAGTRVRSLLCKDRTSLRGDQGSSGGPSLRRCSAVSALTAAQVHRADAMKPRQSLQAHACVTRLGSRDPTGSPLH